MIPLHYCNSKFSPLFNCKLFNQGDSTSFLSKGATCFCKTLKNNILPVQSLTSTIPSLGHYFQRTDLCCLGGSRTLQPSPDFHSRAFCHLNYKTSFCLEVIASPPYSTTPDYHGLPLWILNLRISIISSLNPCKIYRILSMCWIMMTVSVLSPVSTSYLVLDSKQVTSRFELEQQHLWPTFSCK